jgi:diguanylate cyclase (GGDEF)-like protein/PAS domain S-box-containing protein
MPSYLRLHGRAWPLAWSQLITVLAAVVVTVAMVVVAEGARRDEERHQRVEALAGHVREASAEVALLMSLGDAETWSDGRRHRIDSSQFVSRGMAIYANLLKALSALRHADGSPMTLALERDTNRLFGEAMRELPTFNVESVQAGIDRMHSQLSPMVAALGRDATADAAHQQRVAQQASTRADHAYIGSLSVGLLLLLVLGLQLARIRRRTVLVDQRRSLERSSEERIRALVEHSSDIITVVGADLRVRWQSPTVQRTLGHPVDALLGQHLSWLVHPDDAPLLEVDLATATSKPGMVKLTTRFRHADGEWRYLEAIAENRLADPLIEGVVLSMRDVTERKALEDQLRHQAFHDALTGLANRALFEDRLTHGLAGARRHGNQLAVVFLDLDEFKTINDSLGHATGDELLRAVARRIASNLRVTDTAARLGGDEFAVLLDMRDDDTPPAEVAARLLAALRSPIALAGRELRVNASIGVAIGDGSIGVDELLRNADTAMYAAKEAGKGRLQVYEDGMHQRVLDRLELTGELQRGLDHGEFELDYQPIVELDSAQVIGAEALVRWAHPTRGRLAPAEFIGLAEETGLIVPLGGWVLRAACAQGAIWQRDFAQRRLHINVNVSTRQLGDPSFLDTVVQALRESGLEPGLLVLEITESRLPEDDEQIVQQLHNLKALGLRIAVDDFGTGYSALSRLQAFPIDMLKIDRSFIAGMGSDDSHGQLVRGIVDLGKSLAMNVVAEGIEQPQQAARLRDMQSPAGQGYLFSRPLTSRQLHELLVRQKPLVETSGEAASTAELLTAAGSE